MTECVMREFCGFRVRHRADGYLSANDMCKVGKKTISHYLENKRTKAFIAEVEVAHGIPRAELVHTKMGGDPRRQGTWIHPRIAIHLAMWISPNFAETVTDWVFRYRNGDITLVKDVVDKCDAVNNTTSTVVIDTRPKDAVIRSQLDNLELAKKILIDIGCLDDRSSAMIQDQLLNIMGHDQRDTEEVEMSVSLRAERKFDCRKLKKQDYQKIGLQMAQRWRENYGNTKPIQRRQFVDGTLRFVNHYTEQDWEKFGDKVLQNYLENKGLLSK